MWTNVKIIMMTYFHSNRYLFYKTIAYKNEYKKMTFNKYNKCNIRIRS